MVPTSTEAALVSNTGSGCSPRGNLDTPTCTSGCNGHGGHFYGEGGRKPLAMRGDDDDGHNDDKRCKRKLSHINYVQPPCHINQVTSTKSTVLPKETFAAAPWSRESRGGLQVNSHSDQNQCSGNLYDNHTNLYNNHENPESEHRTFTVSKLGTLV